MKHSCKNQKKSYLLTSLHYQIIICKTRICLDLLRAITAEGLTRNIEYSQILHKEITLSSRAYFVKDPESRFKLQVCRNAFCTVNGITNSRLRSARGGYNIFLCYYDEKFNLMNNFIST